MDDTWDSRGLDRSPGAGKTRLVRSLAKALGGDPLEVSSPTFVLIREYQARLPLYHFDAYRLSSSEEFEAIGASEYWEAGGVCLVEWADRVEDQLPEDRWTIRIEHLGPCERQFTIEPPAQHLSSLPRLESTIRDANA